MSQNKSNNYSAEYLEEYFKLPNLSKKDQSEIVRELTKGSEVNMTPSMLVEVLNDHIVSQKNAK